MKTLLFSTLFAALRLYVGSGIFDRIAAEVGNLFANPDLSGSQKMQALLAFAGTEAATLGETLVRAVAEVVLLKLKGV